MKKNNLITRLAAAVLLTAGTLIAPIALAQTSDKPYMQVEEMPVYEGGDAAMIKFLGENMRYPEDARKDSIEGLVIVGFVVDRDGSLDEAKILKGLSPGTDAEALRVVKLMDGRWQPGTQNGKAVAVKYTMPIRFALKKKEKPATAPDRQPAYKGGQEALLQTISQNLKMPEEASQEHLNARVVVTFTVGKDGSVSDIRLAQTKLKKTIGPGSDLDYMDATTFNLQNKTILAKLSEAAVAAVQATSGHWEPANANGQPVAAELTLPLHFLGTDAENTIQPARQEKQSQKDASSPGKEAMIDFLRKNLRYPSTLKQGTITVYYELTDTGKIGSMIGPDIKKAMTEEVILDKALTEEVIRVMKLADAQGVLQEETTGLQSLSIQFRIGDGNPAAVATGEAADVIVTSGTETSPSPKPASQKAQPQKDASEEDEIKGASTPDKDAIYKFLAKNVLYPSTSNQGTATVKFKITNAGYIHYEMSPGFDEAMANEVLRVLKMAKNQGLLHKGNPVMQSLIIKFRIDDGKPAAVATGEAADVIVTKSSD